MNIDMLPNSLTCYTEVKETCPRVLRHRGLGRLGREYSSMPHMRWG